MKIRLNSIERVRNFSTLAVVFDGELTLISGRYRLPAKSILAIFSIDLTKPIELEIECDDDLKREEFIKRLEKLKLLESEIYYDRDFDVRR